MWKKPKKYENFSKDFSTKEKSSGKVCFSPLRKKFFPSQKVKYLLWTLSFLS